MPGLKEVRDQLLLAFDNYIISEEEFLLLYDVNRSVNRDYRHYDYNLFDLDSFPDAEYTEFRFRKTDIIRLKNALQIPDEITCHNYNDIIANGTEALCILLRRLCYPSRFVDLIPRFGRPGSQLCMIFNHVLDYVNNTWGHLLDTLNQAWLSPHNLRAYADAVHEKGAALDYVWGFIDGTLKACCRPERYQRALYSGHKRYHGLKYQSVSTPNGMIAHLYGPIEGEGTTVQC